MKPVVSKPPASSALLFLLVVLFACTPPAPSDDDDSSATFSGPACLLSCLVEAGFCPELTGVAGYNLARLQCDEACAVNPSAHQLTEDEYDLAHAEVCSGGDDDSTGDDDDSSGDDDDTEPPGDDDSAEPCKGDYALTLGGGSGMLDLGLVAPRTPMTLELWVRPDESARSGQIVGQDGRGGVALTMGPNSRGPCGATTGLCGWLFLEEWMTLSVRGGTEPIWQHLALVVESSEMRLYRDGTLEGVLPLRGSMVPSESNLFVGAQPTEWMDIDFFSGTVDEIRLSSVARYSIAFEPVVRHEPDEDTIALWHLDDGDGPGAADATGTSAGLLRGLTSWTDDTPCSASEVD